MATRFDPTGPLAGSLRPPADKSISHRAALIAAMGEGETEIEGYLDAADTRSTLTAVQVLGAEIEGVTPSRIEPVIRIQGVGLRSARSTAIDVGNAGTLLRLLPGWLAGQPSGKWRLDGDDSIRRRPVDRIVAPLRQMGAQLSCREQRLPPLEIEAAPLQGIEYELPIASAQVKSCLLFAGLLAEGETRLRRAARAAAITPSACSPLPGPTSPGCAVASRCARPSASNRASSPCPPTSPQRPSSSLPPCSCRAVS